MINEYGKSDIEELFNCMFTDKCIQYDNEYYFILDNEKVKADKCSTNFYGNSSCTYNGIEYINVGYEKIYKGYHYENTNFYKVTLIFVMLVMFTLVYKFFLGILGLKGE